MDTSAEACAGQFAPLLVGDYRDEAALADFAARVDVVTFDFENVPAESARWLSDRVPVFPNPGALGVAQDRLAEKSLFRELGIPVPPFADVASRQELDAALAQIGAPCILKTRRLGYDGKGQFRLRPLSGDEAAAGGAAAGRMPGADADTRGVATSVAPAEGPESRSGHVGATQGLEPAGRTVGATEGTTYAEASAGAGTAATAMPAPVQQVADAAWAALGSQAGRVGLILESFVPFDRELSVVAMRGRDGGFHAWPLTENWHVDGVLSASLAPARVDRALVETAHGHARRLADALDYVGVFALELFCRDGELLANELAPRVHNSGHWTIEGAETSQFENHLRAVLGLAPGATAMRGHACMLNWIGELPDPGPVLAEPGGHWHDYGKSPRPGRKVGHATLRAETPETLAAALQRVGDALGRQAQVAPVVAALRG
nr:5-(carboxyamino)imidazole ribonucleotide synthase [Luteimonas salinisoli]